MKKQTKRILVSILALLLLLFSGCAGAGRYKTGKHFFDYERTWACEELFIETFKFGGANAMARISDCYAIWKVDEKEIRLSFLYSKPGADELFFLSYTEEEKAKIEAGEAVEREYVWSIESKLRGETLTITVGYDRGYRNGLYSVDHTGKTFVLTEQSRVY